MRMMSMRSTGYRHGVVTRLDALVQKIHRKVGVTDPEHGVGIYWFSDGDASVGSHRHVFWSARVALGANRIMMVDKVPILMQEGDLVIIGPQRHGVPPMPDVSDGSLRISVPFQPPKQNKQDTNSPETVKKYDPVDGKAYTFEEVKAWYAEKAGDDLKEYWEQVMLTSPLEEEDDNDRELDGESTALQQLVGLGFEEKAVEAALHVFGFDMERTIDALLGGEGALLLQNFQLDGSDGNQATAGDDSDDMHEDEALAHRLQSQELEGEQDHGLEEQFAEYERMLNDDEVERSWDGYGDLMHNPARRASLTLKSLGSQTLFSLAASACTERLFFDLLSLHAIRVLYDFRPTDYRDEVRSQQPHFEIRSLKSLCRQRGVHYRHVAVGRETAYGVLRHLQSDEVKHILVELVWQAKHTGRTAFLGQEEDWQTDGRLAVAEELAKHGHDVQHIRSDGSCEPQASGMPMPGFLLQEEARLRKLHARRRAGELGKIDKSAVDRSTEAIARALATEKEQFDIAAELRDAENQTDLARAQKRMVRLQLAESRKEPGLSKKTLVAVPAHIRKEAAEARVRLDAKKKQQAGAHKDSGADSETRPCSSASIAASSSVAPQVPVGNTISSSGFPTLNTAASNELPAQSDATGVSCITPTPVLPSSEARRGSSADRKAQATPADKLAASASFSTVSSTIAAEAILPRRRGGRWGHGSDSHDDTGSAQVEHGVGATATVADEAGCGAASSGLSASVMPLDAAAALPGRLHRGRWAAANLRRTQADG